MEALLLKNKKEYTTKDYLKLKSKEVSILKNDGSKIDGVVHDISHINNIVSITVNVRGDWNERLVVGTDEVEDIVSSRYPYYSMKHKIELRDKHTPQIEFRYTEEELLSLKGKFVSINYDGRRFEGEIVGVFHNGGGNRTNGIVVESQNRGEVKHIKAYRLRELIVIGDTHDEYLGFKRVQKLDDELYKIIKEHYNKGNPEGPDTLKVYPREMLEQYFESLIDIHSGVEVRMDEFDYDWRKRVRDKKSLYLLNNEWTSKSEEMYSSDLIKASECNIFYQQRKELIQDIIYKVKDIDWKKYGRSQKEGELFALDYICQSDFIYEQII